MKGEETIERFVTRNAHMHTNIADRRAASSRLGRQLLDNISETQYTQIWKCISDAISQSTDASNNALA